MLVSAILFLLPRSAQINRRWPRNGREAREREPPSDPIPTLSTTTGSTDGWIERLLAEINREMNKEGKEEGWRVSSVVKFHRVMRAPIKRTGFNEFAAAYARVARPDRLIERGA